MGYMTRGLIFEGVEGSIGGVDLGQGARTEYHGRTFYHFVDTHKWAARQSCDVVVLRSWLSSVQRRGKGREGEMISYTNLAGAEDFLQLLLIAPELAGAGLEGPFPPLDPPLPPPLLNKVIGNRQ